MTDEFEQFLWVKFLPLFAAPRGDRPRREQDFLAHLWTTAAEAGSAIGIRASAFLIALPTRPWSASATSHAVEKSSMSTQSFSAMCAGLPHVAMSSVRRFASNEYVPSIAPMPILRHRPLPAAPPDRMQRLAAKARPACCPSRLADRPAAAAAARPTVRPCSRSSSRQSSFPVIEIKALHGGRRGVQRFPCSGVHPGCSAGAASVQRASSEACSVYTSP